jgi:hypothetical protein
VKLRKQRGAKLAVIAATLSLLGGFYALVRANPHIEAAAPDSPSAAPGSYRDFFFPAGTPATGEQPVLPQPRPHTRTRAS